jgi:uncharacterized membrane protein SpoIIM required for sporulation
LTPAEFERRHAPQWVRLEAMLEGTQAMAQPADAFDLPGLYRESCQHLALARDRGYPTHLVARLNSLVQRGHQCLYRPRSRFWSQAWHYATVEFPQRVRAERTLVLWSALALFGPLLTLMLLVRLVPETVFHALDADTVSAIERMYAPGNAVIGRERAADTDFMMFGHYIRNNIGISFQVFATGLIPFLGPLFFLVFNGVVIGAVAGHLTQIGSGGTFWPFVSGHGSLELTAIAIAGAAGLKLSRALVAPGGLPRRTALTEAARDAVRIMYGVTAMLLIAAFIEAFWSSSRWLTPEVKYGAAAILWTAVACYFLFQGRPRRAPA